MERETPSAIQAFDPSAFEDTLTRKLSVLRREMDLLLWVHENEMRDGQIVAVKGRLHANPMEKAVKVIEDAAEEHGLVVYDATTVRLVGTPKHFQLRIDGQHESSGCDPKLEELMAALEIVDVKKGVCFAILSNHRGNYVQVYGCDARYAVEWRIYRDRTWMNYRHLAAGHTPVTRKLVPIGIAQKHITKFTSEILTLDEAKQIFTAFFNGEKPPKQFHWRNMTDEVPD